MASDTRKSWWDGPRPVAALGLLLACLSSSGLMPADAVAAASDAATAPASSLWSVSGIGLSLLFSIGLGFLLAGLILLTGPKGLAIKLDTAEARKPPLFLTAFFSLVTFLCFWWYLQANAVSPPEAFAAIGESFMRIREELWTSLLQTLYMVFFSTFFSFVIGFLMAALMIVTGPTGLRPNQYVYQVLDVIVDITRSLPFIILIIFIMPLTRLVMGTAIGTTATILPLTVAAAPFAARIIEANFLEVDRGVIEAARAFGAGTVQIIFRVMLPEALPAIALNVAVLAIALLGYSAMAGAVGGGGLGDLAYRIGYNRFQNDVSVWCILVLLVLVRLIQMGGNYMYHRLK